VFDQHDGLRERITQDGDLRRFVNVYVNDEDVRYLGSLETEVRLANLLPILVWIVAIMVVDLMPVPMAMSFDFSLSFPLELSVALLYPRDAGEDLPDDAGEPPCDEFGYVDTVAEFGGWASFGSEEMAAVSNQYAAMPSLHFGYSLIVGVTLVAYARRPAVRIAGALYPPFMLFDIVATGNHFLFDAAMGGLVVLAAWVVARALVPSQGVRVAAPRDARQRAVSRAFVRAA
jgi:hypothetical protein